MIILLQNKALEPVTILLPPDSEELLNKIIYNCNKVFKTLQLNITEKENDVKYLEIQVERQEHEAADEQED